MANIESNLGKQIQPDLKEEERCLQLELQESIRIFRKLLEQRYGTFRHLSSNRPIVTISPNDSDEDN